MAQKITKLTPEQEKLIEIVAREYEEFAHNGDQSIDPVKMRTGIDFIYSLVQLPPPEIVECKSPADLAKQAKLKKGETIDWMGCGYDSGWTAFYDYFERIGVVYDNAAEFAKWKDFVRSGVYATVLCEQIAFVCPRPASVKRLANGQLHNATGAALAWDGDEYFFLNGVHVTKEIVMTPAEKLDVNLVTKEKNAEIRRELVRKIGIERLMMKLGAEVIDKQGDYELVSLNLGDGRKRPYLKMKNPSINAIHVEGVEPSIKTVKAALEWRNQSPEEPAKLT